MKSAPAEFDTVVVAQSLIAKNILRIDCARADGAAFPPWDPGSHVDLILPSGIERQYSLCGNPDDPTRWTIAILREQAGRGGSAWLHDNVEVGTRLRIRGPSNHFTLERAPRYRFIAAGIGITAVLPMIRSLSSTSAEWQLDYAAKSAGHTAFLDDVKGLSGGQVRLHLAADGQRFDIGSLAPAAGELVYACGPAKLLDALGERSENWDEGVLRMERFEAVRLQEPRRNEPVTVELLLSGTTVEVGEHESILEAAERAGVFVLSSCREGTCGTCETAVVSGNVDHRDSILSEAERRADDRMMICVSRATSAHLALEL